MNQCTHPTNMLTGCAKGVVCGACGKHMTHEEYLAHLHPPEPPKAKPKGGRKAGTA